MNQPTHPGRADRHWNAQQHNLASQYGLSWNDVEEMHTRQEGKCVICKEPVVLERLKKNRAHIDHCHRTGYVRGLLCRYCNAGLGFFKDNPTNLESAIAYLERAAKNLEEVKMSYTTMTEE